MEKQRSCSDRVVSRRAFLGRGSALAGVVALGVSLQSERATAKPTKRAWGESGQAFATSHSVESAGFDDKPFWFDGPNGSTVRFSSTRGEQVASAKRAVPDGHVGWRIADTNVDRTESAPWGSVTTLFLPTEAVVERGRETRYRLVDVGSPVVGQFRRLNGNHTTEHLYPVSVERIGD